MNLSKEQLQFIDTYLNNSEVVYTDVRLELTDHIASTIETELVESPNKTFYEVFKDYMVKHKKSLLKNHEEQQIKIRKKILVRFAKGFLAKQVLFLMVLALITINYVDLAPFEDNILIINLGIGFVFLLFYFFIFHKVKKTSVGGSLITIVYVPMYAIYYLRNPLLFFVVVLLTILFCKHEKWIIDKKEQIIDKIGREWLTLMMFFTFVLCFIPLAMFFEWLKEFVTNSMMTIYFFFQFIMWYVLCKTLIGYKRELDIKYKEIFN